jgi:1,2-diacylglycerol 3-alpha-glucosyltransferase
MKILHCCLAAFYIDNYGYQENILPRMHQMQGHEVSILASTETYVGNSELGYVAPSSYFTNDGIPITRVAYSKWLPEIVMRKLRVYKGISRVIKNFEPDIIFIHDCQFISIIEIASYVRKHPEVRVYVDGHTDLINSGTNWLSLKIQHGIIYKWCAKKIEPFTTKFYGVLPIRVDFYKDIYGIPAEKIELLVMGADHTLVDLDKRDDIRKRIRDELNMDENDFVIVTGGKIDRRKRIHTLMRAVNDLQIKDIRLIVFGVANNEMKAEIEELAKSASIKYIGWVDSIKTYDYFLASDLAFFPGTHSVLWEQAVGVGLPGIFKRWEGMQHVDLNGNCLFIDSDDLAEIREKILLVYENRNLLVQMKKVAMERGIKEFSYYEIAKRAIEE